MDEKVGFLKNQLDELEELWNKNNIDTSMLCEFLYDNNIGITEWGFKIREVIEKIKEIIVDFKDTYKEK